MAGIWRSGAINVSYVCPLDREARRLILTSIFVRDNDGLIINCVGNRGVGVAQGDANGLRLSARRGGFRITHLKVWAVFKYVLVS